VTTRHQSPVARFVRTLPPGLRRHRIITLLARLVPGGPVATFTYNGGAPITADLSDPAPRQALITGSFDPEYFSIARACLAPGGAVFDVGANAGFSSFGLVHETDPRFGPSFHLFEADPALCRTLRRSAELYPEHRIAVVEGCVADAPGRSGFRRVPGHSGASHRLPSEDRGADGGLSVPNVVLDRYVEQTGIDRVAFAKLDVEGSEPAALRGFAGTVKAGRVGALYVEVSAPNLSRYGTAPNELLELLEELGCATFWCKTEDFDSGLAPTGRPVTTPGGRQLRLAPVRELPPDHQTDLLAIPRNGPLAHLPREIERLDPR